MNHLQNSITDDKAYRYRDLGFLGWVSFILLFVGPLVLTVANHLHRLIEIFLDVCDFFFPQAHDVTIHFGLWNFDLLSVDMPVPTNTEIIWNLIIGLLLTVVLVLWFKKTKSPIAIFALIVIVLFDINCFLFMVAPEKFYFDGDMFSERFMQIEIICWFAILFISAASAVLFSRTNFLSSCLLVLKSFVITYLLSIVKYVLVLKLLTSTSAIYATTAIIFGGVLVDVIIYVFIYARFAQTITVKFNEQKPSRWLV